MIDIIAQITPEVIQGFLDIEVGLGMTLGTVILIALASLGLPVLHPGVREKMGLQKPKLPKNEIPK